VKVKVAILVIALQGQASKMFSGNGVNPGGLFSQTNANKPRINALRDAIHAV
jgi:hypothetical protein